jgi:hypothetical protein
VSHGLYPFFRFRHLKGGTYGSILKCKRTIHPPQNNAPYANGAVSTLAGFIADSFGSTAAFLVLAVVAAAGFVLVITVMPETRDGFPRATTMKITSLMFGERKLKLTLRRGLY